MYLDAINHLTALLKILNTANNIYIFYIHTYNIFCTAFTENTLQGNVYRLNAFFETHTRK